MHILLFQKKNSVSSNYWKIENIHGQLLILELPITYIIFITQFPKDLEYGNINQNFIIKRFSSGLA